MSRQPSLFQRLMLGFGCVIILVALVGLLHVLWEAKATQRSRTAAENKAHAQEALQHLVLLAGSPDRVAAAAQSLEALRVTRFRELDYHSRVRMRVYQHDRLLYNSQPSLPDKLPEPGSAEARHGNAWVRTVASDAATGLMVDRSHEVDDEWMLSISGVSFLLSSTVFSLPLLLLPAWLIVGIGLRPLRSFAETIGQRSVFDLTALPDSKYKELSPLVEAINSLMARLSQRIEREHEFLTDAAHELKTPLAAIQINAHLLLSRSADNAERRAEAAAGLREGVARATHMVHQLLALERAHTEPGAHPAPLTDLGGFVRARLAAAAPLAVQRGIELEFVADADCMMPVHTESMASLLDNLISNAIKYSPENGRITVRLMPTGAGQRLTITDQGPGIDPQLHSKVFERFYRIPGQEQLGSGLGLAIAERGAQRNNGVITLGSGDDGRGLTATVDFTPA
jgi:two-component system OmpR family sensor kinase